MKRHFALAALVIGASACGLGPTRVYPTPTGLSAGPAAEREAIRVVPAPSEEMAFPPWPQDGAASTPAAVTTRTLKNGVPVHAIVRPGFVSTLLLVVGTRAVPAPAQAAHVYAHAAMFGRPLPWSSPNYEGAKLFSGDREDFVVLGLTSLAPVFVDLVGRAVPNFVGASLWDIDVDDAKSVLFGNATQREGDQRARAALLAGVFPAPHPYGAVGRATPAEYRAVTVKQVRAFRDANVAADNVAVVAVGSFDLERLVATLDRALAPLPAHARAEAEALSSPTCRREVVVLDDPSAVQVTMSVGFPAVTASHRDSGALEVIAGELGPTLGSRLNMALRHDLRLTYGFTAKLDGMREGGVFVVGGGVEPGRVAEALKRTRAEIDALIETPLTADALALAKIRALHALSSEGAGESAALQLAASVGVGRSYDATARIRAVSSEEVKIAARRYLKAENQCIVLVGRASSLENELAGGGFKTIVQGR